MRSKTVSLLVAFVVAVTFSAAAQMANPAPSSTTTSQPATASAEMSSDLVAYGQMLGQLRQVSQQTASDLERLKIEKWKTDSSTKQQSQSSANSLQRNLTAALPEMIQKAQAAPQDFAPSFKLYRNLNAVYDVLSATAESAGAFGPKDQYDSIANDVGALDQLRRSLADRLDWLSSVKDGQITQLRQQLVAAQQVKPKTENPDTSTPKKKPTKKKKTAPKTE